MKEVYMGSYINGEIEIEEVVPVFDNKFITVFNDKVIFPGGNKGLYIRTSWKAPYGVMVAPITKDGNLVLIKNFRHDSRAWGWELVKGFGIEGMTKEDCANKELEEEIGIKSDKITELKSFTDQGIISTIFVAKKLKSGIEERENEEAISEVKEFTKKEAKELIFRDDCRDTPTLFVLSLFINDMI